MKTYYNYQDTDGNYKYKEYQDNGTENIYGIIPREIPVKYIKNTIQTPFTNLDTEFNLSLYSQNNKAGIDNQLFCMFTEIRIITLNGQLNYFFKEFREQVVFDTPQTKRSFDVGDIFEYYDCDNKPINNGGTGPFKHDYSYSRKTEPGFKFQVKAVDVIVNEEVLIGNKSNHKFQNKYEYQCIPVGDFTFTQPSTIFYYNNPLNSKSRNYRGNTPDINFTVAYVDLFPTKAQMNSSKNQFLAKNGSQEPLKGDIYYYNSPSNYDSGYKYSIQYQTITWLLSNGYTGLNVTVGGVKNTYTSSEIEASGFKDNRYVIPHSSVDVNESNNGNFFSGAIVFGSNGENVFINSKTGTPSNFSFEIQPSSLFSIDYYNLRSYTTTTSLFIRANVISTTPAIAAYASFGPSLLLRTGNLVGGKLTQTRVTYSEDKEYFVDIELDCYGKPYGSTFMIDYLSNPLNANNGQITNFNAFGKIRQFSLVPGSNNFGYGKKEGDVFESSKGFRLIITKEKPVQYQFISCENSLNPIENFTTEFGQFDSSYREGDIVSIKNRNFRQYFRNTSSSKTKFVPNKFETVPETIFPEDNFVNYEPEFPVYYSINEVVKNQNNDVIPGLHKAVKIISCV